MRMRGHEEQEQPMPPSFPPPNRPPQRTASPRSLSGHSTGERLVYPLQAPPSERPVAFPMPERPMASSSWGRPAAYVHPERTGSPYVAQPQPRDNTGPVTTDYRPPTTNVFAQAGSWERGGSGQSTVMGSSVKDVSPELGRQPRANFSQEVAPEFNRVRPNVNQYPSNIGRLPPLPPAREFIRPPKYGGHSKRDQLGSIAESWGPDQSDYRRIGLFQQEAEPPSPPSSPSYGKRNRW